MSWSVGIGTTNACNLNCPHCYSRQQSVSEMDYEQVKGIIDKLDMNAINFGTGENGLNRDFDRIIDLVKDRNIKCSLTSNGYTVSKLTLERLKSFNDIDISLEFPNKEKQSEFRGKDSWNLAIKGIERCVENGVSVSIACCLMNINKDYIPDFINLMTKYGIDLRINLYKPVNTNKYQLTYDEFWQSIRRIFSQMKLVACSEPIINIALDRINDNECLCGKKSIRIRPNGVVLPCVYWDKSDITTQNISMLNEHTFDYIHDIVPVECEKCEYLKYCSGGCAGRRLYSGLTKPDEYCPVIRNEKIRIPYQISKFVTKESFVHAQYLCTIILSYR